MRIALVSPYSWTYPGGVTRHIQALARELELAGHQTRILAPFDPDDAVSRRLHKGARPQAMEMPGNLVSLGRTAGFPANGAVSNLAYSAQAVLVLRRELREGGHDVVHIHEPVAPLGGWDALCAAPVELPLVGTFHTYSENVLTNGFAAVPLGGRRRMNRLRVRIAVSEAAAWTATRFWGGRYRIVPNGVHIPAVDEQVQAGPPSGSEDAMADARAAAASSFGDTGPLRILFIGQAVERKGLPVLLSAFEALREQVPATLTLVGASREEIAPLLLDDRGVNALGKVGEERKALELQRAQVLCAPSIGGESFGMVLTEGFAAATPVVASDIPGYRDVVRHEVDGVLVPAGDPLALAQALRELALSPQRRAAMAENARMHAERFAWPRVAQELVDCYREAIEVGAPEGRVARAAVRYGLAPADLQPRVPARRIPSLQPQPASGAHRALRTLARVALLGGSLIGLALGVLALQRIGMARVIASLVASSPGLVAVGAGLMCASMILRALGWHAILAAAPTWRPSRPRDALQGTFVGVLMSATLPARLGEPSRALIVARRLGRTHETLPVVLGTMVSQTLFNLLALGALGAVTLASGDLAGTSGRAALAVGFAPVAALIALLAAPVLVPDSGATRSQRLASLLAGVRRALARVQTGLSVFRKPRQAALASALQLAAWSVQWLSCWFLLLALGIPGKGGVGAAAAVLFAVNITAVIPATPANVGVFQAACVAVLSGAYHVSPANALAYGILLQAVEIATAVAMGMPALVKEGLSWKEVRLRTLHATPVKLPPLSTGAEAAGGIARHTLMGGRAVAPAGRKLDG